MDSNTLWSLRLGFNSKNAVQIKQRGIKQFLEQSFAASYDNTIPSFLESVPRTPFEITTKNRNLKAQPDAIRQQAVDDGNIMHAMLKGWWIEKMMNSRHPLREKITCMLHNHFVVNAKKVKEPYWIYKHNVVLREHAFGNLRELTKRIIRSNAIISYLDNYNNRKGKINENLSRELLELFTLGIGNYTEADIPNGAKALAGLSYGDEEGVYKPASEINEEITYLGRKGKFKADDIVDIIFEQPAAPYLFTRKVLSWFIYDTPPEDLVNYYGNYFRQQDFEIRPLLIKIFSEEFGKDTAGSKIKDPLVYILQLVHETGLPNPNPQLVHSFISSQGMTLYGQPNVKGWPGGYSWITPQLYLRRNAMGDRLCKGLNFPLQPLKKYENYNIAPYNNTAEFKPDIKWTKAGRGNKAVIDELKERLLFDTDEVLHKNFETVLKYDFDPASPGANEAVIRLFTNMVKTPEFQLL